MKLSWQINRIRSLISRPRLEVQNKPVILHHGELCDRAIFIVGAHRSGTSLMRRIINSHRNIACPPETYYLRHYAEMIRDGDTFSGYAGFGYDRAEALVEIRRQAGAMHEAYRLSQGKPRWADKTPQYTAILPELLELFGEKTQFICAVRHPYDILYSIHQRGWRLGSAREDRLRGNAAHVRNAIERMLAFTSEHPDLCLAYRYEALVEQPETTLRGICAFLDEPFDPAMLAFHEKAHNYGTEDPVVRGTARFVMSRDNWTDFTPAERAVAHEFLSDLVETLEYPETSCAAASKSRY